MKKLNNKAVINKTYKKCKYKVIMKDLRIIWKIKTFQLKIRTNQVT